jgi:isopentenyl-diphosphate delta-isomerase
MQKIKIHFVCRGNIYRSRLAEAYLKSIKGSEWEISSSGIGADRHTKITISPWTISIANKNGLSALLNPIKTLTTNTQLQESNIIVFMNDDVYEDAKKMYEFNDAVSIVWHVKDREDWPSDLPAKQKRQRTFKQITRSVNKLVDTMSKGSWVDIVDENNEPLGFTLPIAIAGQKQLWHRGCHALITTPELRTLVEQRSKTIFFAPGLVDITLAGAVDSGETPKQSILREIKEEIGLTIDPQVPRLLELYRWNSYHPHYKRHSKVFLYTYHVAITDENPTLHFQKEEVQDVRILSRLQLKRLLRLHRLRHLGRLNYPYRYYSRMIKLAGIVQ